MRRPLFSAGGLFLYFVAVLPFAAPDRTNAQTIQVRVGGEQIVGKPISWDDHLIYVMERDGAITSFLTQEAQDYQVLSKEFKLFSKNELRNQLQRKFGKNFEVTSTGQFLVVHPAGQRDLWANRFEQLYRSMLPYFKVRGMKVRPSALPFVAIVLRTQAEYARFMREFEDVDVGSSLGMYLSWTNCIYLYDVTAGQPDSEDWYINNEVIIHETAHQTAYNIGVQRRKGADPRWVTEGIGTLFEARGVWDSNRYRDFSDRVNMGRLRWFRDHVNDSNSLEIIKNLIASDRLFEHQVLTSYATCWAMTFYATERRPREYTRYLQRMYDRPAFDLYSSDKRISDFVAEFGDIQRFANETYEFARKITNEK
jgi:hypothetical protein